MTDSLPNFPEVDVVVPCYNYGRFLRDCIGSVLTQSGVRVRILIIDDCSTDDTQEVGRELVVQDSRVSYRRHETNKGHIATYNEGLLEWATAPYSVLLSADDMLAPGSLSRATGILECYPNVGMVYGMALVVAERPSSDQVQGGLCDEIQVVQGEKFLDKCFSETYCLISTPTVVVRTTVQRRLGGYRQDLPHSGDVEMWMRFGLAGDVGVVRAIQGYYRWHGGNMGQKYYVQKIGDQEEFAEACRVALASSKERHAKADEWWDSISKKLGEEAFWSASKAFDSESVDECRAWSRFAVRVCPKMRYSVMWRRLTLKRLMGVSVWRTLRPLLERMRGAADHADRSTQDEAAPFGVGRLVGWWPGDRS